jgi:membrane protease YdiL (CAAX protease family)
MLFYAKQHARIAVLVMLALVILSNVWANLRGFALSDAVALDLASLAAAALGLVLAASIDSVIYLSNWIVGFHPFLDAFNAEFSRLFARVGVPAILAGGLLAALGEETFFRGILQNEWGLVPAAAIFALAHVGRGLRLFSIWALLEGLLFGSLYQLTGNLLVPMIVHGVHDSAGMFAGRYLYGRVIPPAGTLSEWLHVLNVQPAPTLPASARVEEASPELRGPSETPEPAPSQEPADN